MCLGLPMCAGMHRVAGMARQDLRKCLAAALAIFRCQAPRRQAPRRCSKFCCLAFKRQRAQSSGVMRPRWRMASGSDCAVGVLQACAIFRCHAPMLAYGIGFGLRCLENVFCSGAWQKRLLRQELGARRVGAGGGPYHCWLDCALAQSSQQAADSL